MLLNGVVSLLRRKLSSTRQWLELSLLTLFTSASLVLFKVYMFHLAYFRFFSSDRMVVGRFWGTPEGIPMFSVRGMSLLRSSLLSRLATQLAQ